MTKNKNRAKLSFILCLALVLSLVASVIPPVEAYAEGENVIASLDMQINWNNMTAFEDLDEEGVTLPASAFSFNSEHVEPAGGFWMYKIGDKWEVITSSEIIETLEQGTPVGLFVRGLYEDSYVLTENSAISCNDFELFNQAFSEDYFELGFNLGTKAEVEELIAQNNQDEGGTPELDSIEIFVPKEDTFGQIVNGQPLPNSNVFNELEGFSVEVKDKRLEPIRVYGTNAKWMYAPKNDVSNIQEVEGDHFDAANTDENYYLLKVEVISDFYLVDPNTIGSRIFIKETNGGTYAVLDYDFLGASDLETRNSFNAIIMPAPTDDGGEGGGPSLDPAPNIGNISINVNNLPSLVVGEALPDISSTTVTTNNDNLVLDSEIGWLVKFTQKYRDIAREVLADEYVNFEAEMDQALGGWLPAEFLGMLVEEPYVVNDEDIYGVLIPLCNYSGEFGEIGYGLGEYAGQISCNVGQKDFAHAEYTELYVSVKLDSLGGGQQTPSRPSSRPSSKPSSSTETPTVTVPVSNNENKVNVEASVKDNEATIKPLDQKEINQIVGDDKAAGDVVIDVTGLNKDVDGVGIPKETLDAIVDAAEDAGNDTEHLVIKMSTATLTFDDKAMRAIAEQAEGDVVEFHFDDVNTSRLNSAQKDAVKDMDIRKGFEAYITVNGNRVSDFRGGTAEIVVPYAVPTGENIKAFSVWFIAEDGTPEKVKSTYDGVNKWFTVSHFSDYVIAYDEADAAGYNVCPKDDSCIIANFSDAQANAWYHDGVHYCLDHGIMTGYENGTFGPAKQTTRAHVVQMLYSLEGTPSYTHADKFTDVSEDAWYHDAVLWAEENNIVAGTSATKFAPNKAITREQMVAILYRYAQYKGYDVSVGLETNILSYADASEVAEYAIPAMQWACGAGIVTGVEKNGTAYLAPKGDAVRSQTATMFFNLCEKIAK